MAKVTGIQSTVGEVSSTQEMGHILYCIRQEGEGGYRRRLVLYICLVAEREIEEVVLNLYT